MKSALIAILMLGVQAWGQSATEPIPAGHKCTSWAGNLCLSIAPIAPLKCGKYQHVENPIENMCARLSPKDQNQNFLCTAPANHVVDVCADDMHSVSEREWQELMARLKALEKLTAAHEAGHSLGQ